MPDSNTLELVVRTPHEVVFREQVLSARVLTETGHVGLRPRTEAMLLAVEAGIVNVRVGVEGAVAEQFIGAAGGLLIMDGLTATLMTPLAVVGSDERQIVNELEQVLQLPNSEMEARATLTKLEGHILSELRRDQRERVAQRLEESI